MSKCKACGGDGGYWDNKNWYECPVCDGLSEFQRQWLELAPEEEEGYTYHFYEKGRPGDTWYDFISNTWRNLLAGPVYTLLRRKAKPTWHAEVLDNGTIKLKSSDGNVRWVQVKLMAELVNKYFDEQDKC